MFTNTSRVSFSAGTSFFLFAVHNGCPQKQALKLSRKIQGQGRLNHPNLFALMLQEPTLSTKYFCTFLPTPEVITVTQMLTLQQQRTSLSSSGLQKNATFLVHQENS
jgi:hypothetical protein